MVVDKNHQIWLTTNKGLGCINAEDESISSFYTPFDNKPLAFKSFPRRLSHSPGKIYFFTSDAYLYLNTDSINKHIPTVAITGIDLFGNELQTDSLISLKKQLKLKYNQNFLVFHFSALDYTLPEKNRFAYKLEGIDHNWIYADASSRVATYTSLPPGNYRFVVKACNNDLVWNQNGTYIDITITPPWYRTTIAYILYVIFGIFAFYMFITIRERQLVEDKRILEQKVTERTETIVLQNKEITKQHDHIAEQNKNIMDSINYAKRIQSAMLPPDCLFQQYFSDYFILYQPRDIVSGDFYWLTEKDNNIIIAAADCTGHGVPGSLMSMLGMAALTEITSKSDEIVAATILDQLRNKIISLLRQSDDRSSTKDGMDISICIYNREAQTIQNAGAFNSVYMIKDGELQEVKADRMPIGISERKGPFKNNDINVSKGDIFYMFSDGYVDEFHWETQEKFKSKRFQELINKNHMLSMKEQYQVFNTTINDWIGTGEQIDDIMLIGFKI